MDVLVVDKFTMGVYSVAIRIIKQFEMVANYSYLRTVEEAKRMQSKW